MFTTHQSKMFTDLTNRRTPAETYCKNRWYDSIWMTGIDPELPLTHIVLSVQQFILQNKEYWNIPNLTAGNSFLLSKREIKSPRQLKALSDRQPKVQSVIFQSWISTPETLKSLSHLPNWYPSTLPCCILWTNTFLTQMSTTIWHTGWVIFEGWTTQFNTATSSCS